MRWGSAGVVCGVAVLVLAGCVRSNSVTCDGGLVCPEGNECRTVRDSEYCVSPEQLATCAGKNDGDDCDPSSGPGTCYEGVCLPIGCGNGRVDRGEACDDANSTVGDGCSLECNSDETCGNGITDAVTGEQCDFGDRLAHDGCSSNCRVEFPLWVNQSTSTPGPRADAAMAYDARRGRAVMFGGRTATGYTDETWEWNGVGWTKPNLAIAPSGRRGAGIAYDVEHGQTIIFGGQMAFTTADTWAYDGATWRVFNPTDSPQPRIDPAMVYDAKRKRIVLYGGFIPVGIVGGGPYGDAWEFDGTDWTRVCDDCAPGPRTSVAMAYDPVRGVVVMFGGGSLDDLSGGGGGVYGDTWEYDGTNWTQRTPAVTPPARAQAKLAWDPIARVMVLSGGCDGTGLPLGDNWLWDGQSWAPGGQPYAQRQHAVALDVTGKLVAFGGSSAQFGFAAAVPGGLLADTRVWNRTSNGWDKLTTLQAAPPAISRHAAAYDSLRARAVVFGGTNAAISRDTWELEGDVWQLRSQTGPPARIEHAMAYDPLAKKTMLFGGNGFQDTWLWDGTTWQPAANGPSSLTAPSLAFDGTRVILFGGGSDQTTWGWSGTAWTQLATQGPPGRSYSTMAFDPIRRRVVVFGGSVNNVGFHNDTWEWDGSAWHEINTPTRPPPRSNASMAYDASRGRVILFGGTNGSPLADTWEYDGSTWTPVLVQQRPEARDSAILVEGRAGVVLYGGSTMGAVADVWRLRYDNGIADESCIGTFDTDGDGLAGCNDPDCWWTCSPLCPPGVSCAPGAPTCGDGTVAGTESCSTCAADVGACNHCGDSLCDGIETTATCPGDCP